MKKILLIMCLSLFSHAMNYNTAWAEVRSFEYKSLPKSALSKIESIYTQAKLEANSVEFVRASLERMRKIERLESKGRVKKVESLEQALKEAPTKEAKLLLSSILAQLYHEYVSVNSYNIDRLSKSKNTKLKGLEALDIKEILEKAHSLYRASLGEESKNVPIEKYAKVLTKIGKIQKLRPTLYDFLAFRAMKFFSDKNNYLYVFPHKPFVLKGEFPFSDAQTFMYHSFTVDQSDDVTYQTLLFYQKLLRHYAITKNEDAFDALNLMRLSFVARNYSNQKKQDSYYLSALKRIVKKNPQSNALMRLARYYHSYGNYSKTFSYLNPCIADKNHKQYRACVSLKNEIETKNIRIETEQVNVPHENILAWINYRNSDTVFVKVVKLSSSERKSLNKHTKNARIAYLNSLKSTKTFSLDLPKAERYKYSSTEVSLGAYDVGEYAFIFGTSSDFTKESFYKRMSISNLAYFYQEDNQRLLIVNRTTGKPVKGASVKFSAKDRWTLWKKSDKKGFVNVPNLEEPYAIKIKYYGDTLDFLDEISRPLKHAKSEASEQVYFFTDRAIYRPNQTIHYKGLLTKRFSNKAPKVVSNKDVTVTFYNANSQKVATAVLKTDEFGSFFGTFKAPKSGRLGRMSISSNLGGSKSISIEEYKRPKFEASFEANNKQYKLGEKVRLTGLAKAYAGNAVDGATVRYYIRRTVTFPWYWDGRKHVPVPAKTIAQSEVTTDKDGRFTIEFEASEDTSVEKERNPRYHYSIEANVIDMTGESHSVETSLSLSHLKFTLNMYLADTLNIDDNKTITLHAKDLNGKEIGVKGEIEIKKYIPEAHLYRDRFWQHKPMQQMYSKEVFSKLFKHYRFDESKKYADVKSLKKISFNTSLSKQVDLNDLKQGKYIVVLHTQTPTGVPLTLRQNFVVYDRDSKVLLNPTNVAVHQKNRAYKVGDVALLDLKSSNDQAYMLFTLEQHDKILEEKWIEVKNGLHQEKIKIKKKYQGNVHYRINSIKDNRPFEASGTIKVPWDTDLKVEYLSFRDKLKPNEKEQWKVKISGKNKEKVAAQMVATIYDASLDALKYHRFSTPQVYPYSYMGHREWKAMNFQTSFESGGWSKHLMYQDRGSLARVKGLHDVSSRNLQRYYPLQYTQNEYGELMPMSVYEVEVPVEPIPVPSPIMYEHSRTNTLTQEASFRGGNEEESEVQETKKPLPIDVRENLDETMFFKADLETDEEGNIVIDFKSNEALTRWNFMAFVHTKDLKTAIMHKSLTTQKELMVVTNVPRFFREKDKIKLSAKVVNMTEKDLNGTCELQLLNAVTQKPIFKEKLMKHVTLAKGTSTQVNFEITVPDVNDVPAIQHTLIARTLTHSDAEQVIKPVLSNRIFITESKVLSLKEKEQKTVVFNSLKNNHSSTLSNHKLILEFTSNPAWYAIRALPYLMEYPHECNEQLFARYFANAMSANLIKKHPKIAEVFESWKSKGALKSAFNTNQELKTLLLEETPWVLNAQSEEQQLANVALLFDINRLANEEKTTFEKIKKRHKEQNDGGWAWFQAPKSNWYISQYMLLGFGKLKKMGIDRTQEGFIQEGVRYLDKQMMKRYKQLSVDVDKNLTTWESDNTSSLMIEYLYTRSFYKTAMNASVQKAHDYYLKQALKFWVDDGLYEQATLALTLNQLGQVEEAKKLIASFKERAIVDEKGMYFRYKNGYYWNEMPVETHTLMMEVFATIAKDKNAVQLLKKWLLKEKFSSHWKTTKATTSAIYALFSYDNELMESDDLVSIDFDSQLPYKKKLKKAMKNAQKGTGYFKVAFDNFDRSMATINLKNPNNIEAYGALHWQYFEDLDKVKSFKETPLKIEKELYLEYTTAKGKVYRPIAQKTLKVGATVKVRIKLQVDRDMEYIMLKDSRASTFEPTSVISGSRYSHGLRYYQSTKDAATYFFIDYLKKGKYEFTYTMRTTQQGIFSNGITSIESVYAPEFRSHSKGVMVVVE